MLGQADYGGWLMLISFTPMASTLLVTAIPCYEGLSQADTTRVGS